VLLCCVVGFGSRAEIEGEENRRNCCYVWIWEFFLLKLKRVRDLDCEEELVIVLVFERRRKGLMDFNSLSLYNDFSLSIFPSSIIDTDVFLELVIVVVFVSELIITKKNHSLGRYNTYRTNKSNKFLV